MPNGDDETPHRPFPAPVPLHSIPGDRKDDQQLADAHREAIKPLLEQVVRALNLARADGFYVEYQIPTDNFGRYFLGPISLAKRF